MAYDESSLQPEIAVEIKQALHAILEECEKEDQYSRQIQIREAKQLDHFWHGLQHIFWDNQENTWRIPTHEDIRAVVGDNDYVYDFVINIFTAHGESIIAALSAELPYVGFSPKDADDPLDIKTCKAATQTSKIIQEYNEARELFLDALFTLFTGHLVACYNYYERDSKYGIASIPQYRKEKGKISPDIYSCDCGEKFGEEKPEICPSCASEDILTTEGEIGDVPVRIEDKQVPKGMEKFKIFGIADVKVPVYAKNQDSCGYLIQYEDQHYAYVSTIYGTEVNTSDNSDDSYERSLRSPSIRQGALYDDNRNLVTVKKLWIRPWEYCTKKDYKEQLHKLFPNGVKYTCVGNKFLEVKDENLDDHWTLTKPRPSRTIHSTPLGSPVVPIQEMKNTLRNVQIETVERGIPLTFVNPKYLDFDKFRNTEVGIGEYFPGIEPPSNKSMSDGFFETRSATLSKEVVELDATLDSDGQFVLGDFPSIHGAPATSGSKTLGEYINSRNYALQRLSIPWQYISVWWGRVMYKAINSYFKHQIEDDKFSQKVNGMFRNIWIRKADTNGNFRLLQPEVGTDFPTSIAQKRGILMTLVELNNPEINSLLFAPENRSTLLRIGGLVDVVDPSEIQVLKQLTEIEELVSSAPITELDLQGNPIEQSSVQIEPEIDDSTIHIGTLTNFMISEAGQELKELNPPAYRNCLMHLVLHKQFEQQQTMEEALMQQPEEGVPENV